jgi:hypothetical protein
LTLSGCLGFPRIISHHLWHSGSVLCTPGRRPGPGLLCRADFFVTLPRSRQIYQSQLYASVSKGAGVEGSATITRNPQHFAHGASAAACPNVNCTPTQFCPSKSQASSGAQSVNRPTCSPQYFVQCYPDTESLISQPPPSLAANVQKAFQAEGTSDYSQRSVARGSSSKVAVNIALILSIAFKGLDSKTKQDIPARSNRLIQDIQLL